MLVGSYLQTFLGKPIGPMFKGQLWTLLDHRNDRQFRNVGEQLLTYRMLHKKAEGQRPHLHRGGSLKSRSEIPYLLWKLNQLPTGLPTCTT